MSSLKKYRKVKYLGKGSYGAAILVELRSNPNQKFVIKEIIIGHLKPQEQTNARNEAEVLNQLSHSNITMYIESFVESSKLYIVMEYADGGDLAGAIKRQKALGGKHWEEEDIMRIFVQICLALKHVHDANILHRDLKAQNIFLTSQGIVKLGDFGIAKVLDATDDQAKTQIGTPYYLSPEICESKPYGRSSDVWSLGVILFELAALELPFVANSLPLLVHQICSAEPRFAATKIQDLYSPELIHMIKSILHKNPDKRPSIKDILKTEFIKVHISKLLSYTIKSGNATGGLEGVAAAAIAAKSSSQDPDEIHEDVDRVNWQKRELELKKEIAEINSKESADREYRRNEDREKLRKFRQEMSRKKDDNSSRDSDSPIIQDDDHYRPNPKPFQSINQSTTTTTVVTNSPHLQPRSLAEYQRSQSSSKDSSSGSSTGLTTDRTNSSTRGSEFESFARQEYFANRAAAAKVKAKIEMNMNSGSVLSNVKGPILQSIQHSNQQVGYRNGSSSGYTESESEENSMVYDDPEKRIAAIRAQKEKEKQLELENKQKQLEEAAAAYRQQKKTLEAKRAAEVDGSSIAFSVNFDNPITDSKPLSKIDHTPLNQAQAKPESVPMARPSPTALLQAKKVQSISPARGQWDKNRMEPKITVDEFLTSNRQSTSTSTSTPVPMPSVSNTPDKNLLREGIVSNSQGSQGNGRKGGWTRPSPGEDIVVAPLGIVSLPPNSNSNTNSVQSITGTKPSEEENSDSIAVLKKVQSRHEGRLVARQQARDILRKLRDQKQKETKSNYRSDSRNRDRIHSVMNSIEIAKNSVDKAVSMTLSQSNTSSVSKASPIQDGAQSKNEKSYTRPSPSLSQLHPVLEGTDEALEETLSQWLNKQPIDTNKDDLISQKYIRSPRRNDIIEDITSVVIDRSDQTLRGSMKASEVDEDENLIIRSNTKAEGKVEIDEGMEENVEEIMDDEVASLQCELAKALMNNDDE